MTNATACHGSSGVLWSGTQGFNGSLVVKPTSANSYSYTLTCVNANGKTIVTNVLTVVSSGGSGVWRRGARSRRRCLR